jgi:hypothetical protein
MQDELEPPHGPAVQLCGLLGVPCARLRAALPDALLRRWDMSTVLGRRHALSKGGMTSSLAAHKLLVPRLLFSARSKAPGSATAPAPRIPPPEALDEGASAEDEQLELFCGTALVLAFVQVSQLLPVTDIARHKSAAKRHFQGVLTPAGYDFDRTHTDFVTLLSPGILNVGRRWLPRARLWRLILSQSPEGWWDATSTSAFALEARALSETERLPPTLLSRITDMLSGAAEEAAELATGGGAAAGDMLDGGRRAGAGADDVLGAAGNAGDETRTERARVAADMEPVGDAKIADDGNAEASSSSTLLDCPLTCYPDAIAASMPVRLARVGAEEPGMDVLRVWTTLCCIAMLERLNVSWIFGDGDLYPEQERTIVDGAREWVERHAAAHPKLAEALADGAPKRAARKRTAQWRRASEQRVGELRRSDGIRAHMARSHMHRTATGIVRAFVSKHSTFATFLSEPLDGLQRWQSAFRACAACAQPAPAPADTHTHTSRAVFMIIVTLVCSQLLVNIWMFYAKVRPLPRRRAMMSPACAGRVADNSRNSSPAGACYPHRRLTAARRCASSWIVALTVAPARPWAPAAASRARAGSWRSSLPLCPCCRTTPPAWRIMCAWSSRTMTSRWIPSSSA